MRQYLKPKENQLCRLIVFPIVDSFSLLFLHFFRITHTYRHRHTCRKTKNHAMLSTK